MRLACFWFPAMPLLGVALVFPMAVWLPNGVLWEAPLLLRDAAGQLVPTMQHRISYMGLN